MSRALVKNETIDLSQIQEIMAGTETSPPEDWIETPDSGADEGKPKSEGESTGSIGGPASEH
jgi:hypothetical protein